MRIAIVAVSVLFAASQAKAGCPEDVSKRLQGGSWTEVAGDPDQTESWTLHKLIASEGGQAKAEVTIKATFKTHKRWKPDPDTKVGTEAKCEAAYPNTKHHWGQKLESLTWTWKNIDGSGSFEGKGTGLGNVYLCTDGSEFRITKAGSTDVDVDGVIIGGTGIYANVTGGKWDAKTFTVFRESCNDADGCPTHVGKFTASFQCGPAP